MIKTKERRRIVGCDGDEQRSPSAKLQDIFVAMEQRLNAWSNVKVKHIPINIS